MKRERERKEMPSRNVIAPIKPHFVGMWRAKRYTCIPLNLNTSEPFLRSNTLLWPHYHSQKKKKRREKNFFQRQQRSLPKWVWCYEHKQAGCARRRCKPLKKRGISEWERNFSTLILAMGFMKKFKKKISKTTLSFAQRV